MYRHKFVCVDWILTLCFIFVSTVSNKFVWKRVHYKVCFANNLIIAYYKQLCLKRKHNQKKY